MNGHRHAAWWVPEAAERHRLAALVQDLSATLGTPAFTPHVPLVGGLTAPRVELVRRMDALARLLGPVEVALGEVAYAEGPGLHAEVVRSGPLEFAGSLARAVMGVEDEAYRPRLPLACGSPLPAHAARLAAGVALPARRFRTATLQLVDVSGPVGTWEAVGTWTAGMGPVLGG